MQSGFSCLEAYPDACAISISNSIWVASFRRSSPAFRRTAFSLTTVSLVPGGAAEGHMSEANFIPIAHIAQQHQ
jgi:hypothetical protein